MDGGWVGVCSLIILSVLGNDVLTKIPSSRTLSEIYISRHRLPLTASSSREVAPRVVFAVQTLPLSAHSNVYGTLQ